MTVEARLAAIPLGHAERFTKTVSEFDVCTFAAVCGDFYGVHVDEEFARTTRFGGRIAHGAMLVGFISTVMGKMAALVPPPGGVSYRYEITFRQAVRLGDTITTELTLAEVQPERRALVFRARCANQHGETVLEGQTTMKVI